MAEFQLVCTNCGHNLPELYCKYNSTSTVKTKTCDKCHQVADKYIEFESVIVLVDAMLLSESVYRHMLYNRSFKLHWKLSLVLLLLESFALWRKRRTDTEPTTSQYFSHKDDMVREKGFYICCLQNILGGYSRPNYFRLFAYYEFVSFLYLILTLPSIVVCKDYILLTALLLFVIMLLRRWSIQKGHIRQHTITLMKAVSIANFSKFLLLPVMVWRENTTEFGSVLHQLLVIGHHLCALILIFVVVYTGTLTNKKQRLNKLQACLIILPIYILKEYLKGLTSIYAQTMF